MVPTWTEMKPGWLVATGQNRRWGSANSASMPGTILKQDSSTVSTFFSAGVGVIGVSFLVRWSGSDARQHNHRRTP